MTKKIQNQEEVVVAEAVSKTEQFFEKNEFFYLALHKNTLLFRSGTVSVSVYHVFKVHILVPPCRS